MFKEYLGIEKNLFIYEEVTEMIYKFRRRVNERKNFKMKILNTHNTALKHKIKSINIKVNAFITYII